jgi:hypothetical protein
MRNRSSNVPQARAFIRYVIEYCHIDHKARCYCVAALALMTRQSAVRRAPAKHIRITGEQKRRVRAMKHTPLTYHEIANEIGIANSGRVSEIMRHKR